MANARSRAWREVNSDQQRKAEREYRANNPEKRRIACAKYREDNPDKERAYRERYAIENRDKINAKAARRRAAKLQALPAWADARKIDAIYAEAARQTKETGVEHHVDHVHPLQSKYICGLHCEINLRIVRGPENLAKGNRWWPGCEWSLSRSIIPGL